MSQLRVWKKVFEQDIPNLATELKEMLDTPCVLILSGDLGAGKTTIAKQFIDEKSNSPTYSIIQESGPVLHADFYRIEKKEELVHLEIPMYLEDKEYFLVEWGSRYVNELKSEVPDEYKFYELKIEINPTPKENGIHTRNYFLNRLEA